MMKNMRSGDSAAYPGLFTPYSAECDPSNLLTVGSLSSWTWTWKVELIPTCVQLLLHMIGICPSAWRNSQDNNSRDHACSLLVEEHTPAKTVKTYVRQVVSLRCTARAYIGEMEMPPVHNSVFIQGIRTCHPLLFPSLYDIG